MASPFRYFRKNAKIMLAVFVVLLVFSWVIGDSLRTFYDGGSGGGRHDAGAIAVNWDGGSLTNQQVNQMVMLRRVLNTFLQNVQFEGERSAYMAGVEPAQLRVQQLLGPETPQQNVEQSVVQTKLFADAAREAGLRVSDDVLRQYLYQLGRGNVSPQQMRKIINDMQSRGMHYTADDIMNALREEMLAQNFINSNQNSFRTVTPQQRWKDWLRVNERVIVEAAAIPVESFLVDVKDPTEAELQEFYDKYKVREKMPDQIGATILPSATPGFRIPRKIDVAFLEANFNNYVTKAEEKVTEEEIAKFYEENKDRMFIKADTALFDDKPAAKDDAKPASEGGSEAKVEVETPASEAKESAPTSDGGTEAEKSSDSKKTTDEPKADESPKADNSSSEGEKKSSFNRLHLLSPFAVTALLQEDNADAGKSDAPKADPPASEASKTDETKAETAASDLPKTDVPKTDSAPEAEASAPKKPVAYQPLDEVKDLIRRQIAEQNAHEELTKLASQIQGELQVDFEKYLNEVFAAEADNKDRPPAPKSLSDLAPLAEKHGLSSGTTGALPYLQFRETPVGKSRAVDINRVLGDWLFSGRDPDLFEPRTTEADIDGNRFIIVKTSDTPGRVPKLSEVRDEVVRAWKLQKAAELAEKHAEELAKKIEESKQPLTTYFADNPEIKVVRTDLFSELTGGAIGIVNGRFAQQPYRLSQPDGIVAPGPSFMKDVFSLKDGDVGAALNNDHTLAYVIRLVEHQPPLADLQSAYLAEAGTWTGLMPMIQGHFQEVARQLAEDVTTNANVDWKRPPDKVEDADSDSESESGG